MNTEKKYKKRTSFWPTIFSMSLVLFLVGLLGIITIYAKDMVAYYQNNFELSIYFSDTTGKKDAMNISSEIGKLDFVNGMRFVERDSAAREESRKTGDDFIKTLGFNPIPHALIVKIKPEYADKAKMEVIEKKLINMAYIDDLQYPRNSLGKNLLIDFNKNLRTIETVLFTLAIIFLIIALILINSTVRINMFARRFIIKSMQYVGASDWFIIRPFLGMYILYAIISTITALAMLGGLIYMGEVRFEMNHWQDFLGKYLILAGILLVLAILIAVISVYFSTKRYLRLKIDQLY